MAVGDVCRLRLQSIVQGGDALARFEGKPFFIKGGAPSDTALCRITEDRKNWVRAELLEIVEYSPARESSAQNESLCAFYSLCGGCNLAHINYESQLVAKTAILKELILRAAGIPAPEPLIFRSPPQGYRNRMQFHCFRQNMKSDSKLKFGLMEQKSGKIAAITDCPVAEKGIRLMLKQGGNIPLPPEKDRFNVFSKDGLFLNEGGIQRGKIRLLEKDIILDAGLFFQSNCFMLEALIQELRKIAMTADRDLPAADLYSGVGTFAFFLSELFPKIILAEENKTAVSIARENLKGKNADFFALRDSQWQNSFLQRKSIFGFAVVDPPRTGLSAKLAAALSQEGPPVLVYISCDPASLARDSKILVTGGYKLIKLNLFDFYPQTAHIESLAVFEKKRHGF